MAENPTTPTEYHGSLYYGTAAHDTIQNAQPGDIYLNTENKNIYIAGPTKGSKLTLTNVGTNFDLYKEVMKDLTIMGKANVYCLNETPEHQEGDDDGDLWTPALPPNDSKESAAEELCTWWSTHQKNYGACDALILGEDLINLGSISRIRNTDAGDPMYKIIRCLCDTSGETKTPLNVKYIKFPPNEISKLTRIGHFSCSFSNLKVVDLPDSVTLIYPAAFSTCKQLTRVTLPKNLTYLGLGAFTECTNLKGVSTQEGELNVIRLPDTLKSKDGNSEGFEAIFKNCSSLGGSVYLSNNKEFITIGNQCFYNTAITSVYGGTNVTTIGVEAFAKTPISYISGLENVEIIEDRAFMGASFIGSNKYAFSVPNCKEIGNEAFEDSKMYPALTSKMKLERVGDFALTLSGSPYQSKYDIANVLPDIKELGFRCFGNTPLVVNNALPGTLQGFWTNSFNVESLSSTPGIDYFKSDSANTSQCIFKISGDSGSQSLQTVNLTPGNLCFTNITYDAFDSANRACDVYYDTTLPENFPFSLVTTSTTTTDNTTTTTTALIKLPAKDSADQTLRFIHHNTISVNQSKDLVLSCSISGNHYSKVILYPYFFSRSGSNVLDINCSFTSNVSGHIFDSIVIKRFCFTEDSCVRDIVFPKCKNLVLEPFAFHISSSDMYIDVTNVKNVTCLCNYTSSAEGATTGIFGLGRQPGGILNREITIYCSKDNYASVYSQLSSIYSYEIETKYIIITTEIKKD